MPTLLRTLCVLLPLFAGGLLAEALDRSGVLAENTKWETPYYLVESGEPGPIVLITGGVHGDEPAGARAAEQIRHWPIKKGRLVVIPRVNQPALAAGTRFMPGEDKAARDLNRNFPKTGGPQQARGELAQALWAFVEAQKPDWVLDLHEGYHFHRIHERSVGSSIIEARSEAARAVIPTMLAAVNSTITDPEKKFENLRGTVLGSLARAASDCLGAGAMTLETTTREQPLSLRTRQHRLMVHALLTRLGMISRQSPNFPPPSPEAILRVALYDGQGVRGAGPKQLERTIKAIPRSLVWRIGPPDILEGALNHFDLIIFPGGSGSGQAEALGEEGRTRIRNYLEDGGGFLGIGAGTYLAATNYQWSLAISNHRSARDSRPALNEGQERIPTIVKMQLTQAGMEILGGEQQPLQVPYHHGPVITPGQHPHLPEFRVLATLRTPEPDTSEELAAIIATEFGQGRVLCIGPHPEARPALRPLVIRGIQWVARRH